MLFLRVKNESEKCMLHLVKLQNPASLIGSKSSGLGIHFQEIKQKKPKMFSFVCTSVLIVTDT